MQLLKFELYKIFKNKAVYIAFLLLAFLGSSYLFTFDKTTEVERDIYEKWSGTLTEEKVEKANTEYNTVVEKSELRILEMQQNGEGGRHFTEMEDIKVGLFEEIGLITSVKQNSSERLQELENADTYSKTLETNMLKELDLSYFSYNKAPKEIIDFVNTAGFLTTGAMILIGLSTIFTREYGSGVDNYILSSKKGRRSLVWAKVAASLIYTSLVVVGWELINLFSKFILFGTNGWNTPLQYAYKYVSSPYGLSMLEYHSIQLGIHLLTALSFALFVVLISSICRNSLVSFIASGAVFAAPFMIIEMVPLPNWLFESLHFTFVYIMRIEFMFNSFKTVNVFGYPVLYPVIAVALMGIGAVVFTVLLFQVLRNKEVIS